MNNFQHLKSFDAKQIGCNVTLPASDSASFITGAVLSVDGGLTA